MSNTEDNGWYNLKYSIAEFMVPKLEEYLENYVKNGYSLPTWVDDESKENYTGEELEQLKQKWICEVQEIILAFKMVYDPELQYDQEKIQIGINLFAKYYQDLWD